MAVGKSISKSAMWILMGLLILGLGGFGITNLSGTVRSVGSVGEADIDINAYARALQREIRAREAETGAPVSFAQAQAEGIDRMVLSQLVANAALDDETRKLGISIGDENLRDQILDIPGFRGIDGEFDRTAYKFALDQQGLNESAFENSIRTEAARTLVQGAVISGVSAPTAYTDTLLRYVAERRSITFARLGRADLNAGLPEPTDEDLRTYHQSHLPAFTTPETKRITYAWLTPDMIIDTVEVDDAALREAYDSRIEEFVQPERRLVERLGFADAAAAEAARAAIDAGDSSFDDAVAARGLALSDVDMGDVARTDLGAAGEAVFGAEAGDVVGPLDTPIGPALFRVNAVLQANEVTFEEAEPQLRDELAGDRARRVVDSKMGSIDDLLAGGATIEDLASETDMELGQIDWHPGVDADIGAYAAFRQAAAELAMDDYPRVLELDDGGLFAMRLDAVKAPEIQPLESVRAQVEQAWSQDAVVTALRAQVNAQMDQLEAGADFETLGLDAQTVSDLTRRGFQADTPPEFIETVFAMSQGEIRIIDGKARIFVLRLDSILPPEGDDPDLAELRRALSDQAAATISQDIYQALADDIRERAGITLNQQALNAVHANFN